jgi:hypothetical protein
MYAHITELMMLVFEERIADATYFNQEEGDQRRLA